MVEAISRLKKHEVLWLLPDPGKSMRGLKTGLGRIAKVNNLRTETWTDEAGERIHVRTARP